MAVLIMVPAVLFMAAQGAVIFLTAHWCLRLLEISHWVGKTAAMSISYVAWIVFTIGAYTLLGGEGGLMDGFGFILILCFSAMISSLVYLVVWIFRASKDEPKEEILIEPWA